MLAVSNVAVATALLYYLVIGLTPALIRSSVMSQVGDCLTLHLWFTAMATVFGVCLLDPLRYDLGGLRVSLSPLLR